MSDSYKNQEFAVLRDYLYGQPALAVMKEDGLFWFSDGDGYSPANLELTFGEGENIEYLTLYQLEERLFPPARISLAQFEGFLGRPATDLEKKNNGWVQK